MAKRLKGMGQKRYASGVKLTLHDDPLDIRRSRKGGQSYFADSMSDLFHKDIPGRSKEPSIWLPLNAELRSGGKIRNERMGSGCALQLSKSRPTISKPDAIATTLNRGSGREGIIEPGFASPIQDSDGL